jgi:hypothetical protein
LTSGAILPFPPLAVFDFYLLLRLRVPNLGSASWGIGKAHIRRGKYWSGDEKKEMKNKDRWI